jgi:serine phosphatase RsbU (regulator of sigma subunit)
VLAVGGWDKALVHKQLEVAEVFFAESGSEPAPFSDFPPGVTFEGGERESSGQKVSLKAGLRLPLVAQEKIVGLMIVHSTRKVFFAPGEVALLKTFANQAAVAIQRASLIEELQAKIVQLEAAQAELVMKERMEHELELARQVQQSMLPSTFPVIPGFAFAAKNEPARQVGGDFYDVIDLDADHFGIVIADISDKGMPAALYMALTRSLLLAEAHRAHSAQTVLSQVNQILMELGEPRQFVSIFYGVVEKSTRRLTYCRAGHERPLLIHTGNVRGMDGDGAVLGVFEKDELNLSEEQITLESGDRLVLYTDGLTDAMNREGEFFDLGRFERLLLTYARSPADELCANAFAELVAYQEGAEQFDDMTMLVMEIK